MLSWNEICTFGHLAPGLTFLLKGCRYNWFKHWGNQDWVHFIRKRFFLPRTWYVGWFRAALASFPLFFGLSVPISDIYWPRERKGKGSLQQVYCSHCSPFSTTFSCCLNLSLPLSHATLSLILFHRNPFTVAAETLTTPLLHSFLLKETLV